jgi:hypothetical protein
MNATRPDRESPEFSDVCTIVVLYEGDVSRARAMSACDYLVRQFWAEVELKFHWWRTDFLRDEQLAAVAAVNAMAADFLIISSESDREFSLELESWFESWLDRRLDREGALVDLLPASQNGRGVSAREQFLHEVSRRGKFDYLTSIPGGTGEPRQSVTRLIDDRSGESRPPSHYGLNE